MFAAVADMAETGDTGEDERSYHAFPYALELSQMSALEHTGTLGYCFNWKCLIGWE